jgi:pimeloyl-ACP methyl ester carboxylesterase
LVLCLALSGAFSVVGGSRAIEPPVPTAATVPGRIIILPGIRNTRFHLAGFVDMAGQSLPGFEVEVRTWGPPLLGIYNLRAHARNAATARALASEIAEWRAAHANEPIYVIGYSGGGGVAAMAVAALPDGVRVDRLVLVAPALAAAYPAAERLYPHVKEFIANYASERDLQVGLGTRMLGTIDGAHTVSVGYSGFEEPQGSKLAQWSWQSDDARAGHRGNHVAYLSRRWQRAFLLPVIDPRKDAAAVRREWDAQRTALGIVER